MLKIIRELLLKIVDNIDTGNSNMSDEECMKVVDTLRKFTDKEEELSKYQASKELGKSRSMIDAYVKSGKLQLREQQGFKEKFLYRRDIIKLQKELNENK